MVSQLKPQVLPVVPPLRLTVKVDPKMARKMDPKMARKMVAKKISVRMIRNKRERGM